MRAVGVVLALIGDFGIVVTMGALWEATGGGPLGGIGLLALAGAWLYATTLMAGLAASPE
jgi:hypothetical protein